MRQVSNFSTEQNALLRRFPKSRPALSPEYRKIYLEEIRINRGERGGWFYRLLVALESWMHRQVARPDSSATILEIGAGTLNHLAYEPAAAIYDIVEPVPDLYRDSPAKVRVRAAFKDMSDVPLEHLYGRIVSIAAMEHIESLPECIARAGIALEEGGILHIAIPSEGGFLWGLSWRWTTGVLFRLRTGLDYAPLMRFEHINSADEIVKILECFFEKTYIRRFPLPLRHLSFYTAIEAKIPRRDLCRRYLAERGVLRG